MAEEKGIKLDQATRERLANMEVDIDSAKKAMEAMKKLGMDTKPIEDKLAWAEETRRTLLSEFG